VLTAGFRALADQGRTLQATEAVANGPGDLENDKLKKLISAWG
jgi:hypothetical protein